MEKRGFQPETAASVAEGRAIAVSRPPAYAVVDLRLEDGNGLDVVEALRDRRPDCRIVVLTGYGAIATAVAAVKIGATDYLSKPADDNDITNALLAKGEAMPAPPENPMSADRVRWEHIQRVYEMCDRNVSEHREWQCRDHPCRLPLRAILAAHRTTGIRNIDRNHLLTRDHSITETRRHGIGQLRRATNDMVGVECCALVGIFTRLRLRRLGGASSILDSHSSRFLKHPQHALIFEPRCTEGLVDEMDSSGRGALSR
jgi:two-component system response regulator RegA